MQSKSEDASNGAEAPIQTPSGTLGGDAVVQADNSADIQDQTAKAQAESRGYEEIADRGDDPSQNEEVPNGLQGEAESVSLQVADGAASESCEAEEQTDGEQAEPSAPSKAKFSDRLKGGFAAALEGLARFKSPKFSAAYVSKIAILTAIAFLLYAFGKFNLPFMFPSFFEMQISELPALLAGFSMGPVSGCLVVVLKCLFKFPLTSTAYVGEATDMLLGVAFVLPASLIYRLRKDKTGRRSGVIHAIIGLATGSIVLVAAAMIVNRFISIPFYTELYFGGDFNVILNVVRPLYKAVNAQNFYTYYLLLGVLPFNLLRCIIVSLLTFLLYKRLSVILHWEGNSLKKSVFGVHEVKNEKATYALAKRFADSLEGGEIVLLNGQLGAGKTTFVKGVAKALGVTQEVTSPTFTILNVYDEGRLKLYHLDMYRLESADEIYELGVEDCFDGESVTMIEWNKFQTLQGKVIIVDIAPTGENSRKISLTQEEKE